jgi:hypothetical protein
MPGDKLVPGSSVLRARRIDDEAPFGRGARDQSELLVSKGVTTHERKVGAMISRLADEQPRFIRISAEEYNTYAGILELHN